MKAELTLLWSKSTSALLCSVPCLYCNRLLPFTSFLFPFLCSLCLFPWWKLSEASQSATVFIYTRLCPLLKAFLCCSTLWALSCLVSLLVILLALTDSQVKCFLRAACVFVCLWSLPLFSIHLSLSFISNHSQLSVVMDLARGWSLSGN